jgi:hypothetical protein
MMVTDTMARCKCRAEFCYLCGLGWKTFSCERWNEQRLVERAQEVVDREANQALPPGEIANFVLHGCKRI